MTAEPSERTSVSLDKKVWQVINGFRFDVLLLKRFCPTSRLFPGVGMVLVRLGGNVPGHLFLVLITSAIASETLDALVDAASTFSAAIEEQLKAVSAYPFPNHLARTLIPRKTGWRSRSSRVHSVNLTWQTSLGFTQWQRLRSVQVSPWSQRLLPRVGTLKKGSSQRAACSSRSVRNAQALR
jgi:hypothetical protein